MSANSERRYSAAPGAGPEHDARLVEARAVRLVQPAVVAAAATHVEPIAGGVDRAVVEQHARGAQRDRRVGVERPDERREPVRLGQRIGVQQRDERRRGAAMPAFTAAGKPRFSPSGSHSTPG